MIGLFLMAVTLGFLSIAGSMVIRATTATPTEGGPSGGAQERVFTARVIAVTPEQISPELTVFGEVRSRRTLEIRATRAGRVVYLDPDFADGLAVKQGQVLVRLDAADAAAGRDLAQADAAAAAAEAADAEQALILAQDDLAAGQAQLALRAQAVDRQRDLQERQLGSIAAVETAELAASSEAQAVLSRRQALAEASARVTAAKTAQARAAIALAEAERALEDTTLVAAFDGVLSGVSVLEGGLLGMNERIADLVDASALEVSFRVSTAQFSRLLNADGALISAPIRVALNDLSTNALRARAAAAVGEGQSGRLIYAGLERAAGFRPGDFVTVSIAEPMLDNVVLLPSTAVDAGGQLLVLGAEDRLELLGTEVLRRQGNDVIVAAGGLAGREVVAERSPLLGAGIKIKPLREGAMPEVAVSELVDITPERRAELIAFVEANTRMPDDAKARVLEQLAQDRVPADVVARLEQRMGG